jgi:hypothetical protein
MDVLVLRSDDKQVQESQLSIIDVVRESETADNRRV